MRSSEMRAFQAFLKVMGTDVMSFSDVKFMVQFANVEDLREACVQCIEASLSFKVIGLKIIVSKD